MSYLTCTSQHSKGGRQWTGYQACQTTYCSTLCTHTDSQILIFSSSRVHFVETVESVSLVSKCFYHLTQESALWKSHYLSVFGSLERTKGSNWLAKFTERWQVRMKLKNYHIRSHTLSPYPLEFDLVDIFGNFVAAHSNSDFIALDIVHLWDLRKDKPYALSPSSEALPTALKLSSKYLAVGLTV